MQIRKWCRPGTDEVRYYVDLRFGPAPFLSRDGNRLMHGRWVGRGDDGMAHVYANGRCRTVDGPWLDTMFLGTDPITFDQWEQTFNACLTKSGNFSLAKYMKM